MTWTRGWLWWRSTKKISSNKPIPWQLRNFLKFLTVKIYLTRSIKSWKWLERVSWNNLTRPCRKYWKAISNRLKFCSKNWKIIQHSSSLPINAKIWSQSMEIFISELLLSKKKILPSSTSSSPMRPSSNKLKGRESRIPTSSQFPCQLLLLSTRSM